MSDGLAQRLMGSICGMQDQLEQIIDALACEDWDEVLDLANDVEGDMVDLILESEQRVRGRVDTTSVKS